MRYTCIISTTFVVLIINELVKSQIFSSSALLSKKTNDDGIYPYAKVIRLYYENFRVVYGFICIILQRGWKMVYWNTPNLAWSNLIPQSTKIIG
jgi:hypothetical protein